MLQLIPDLAIFDLEAITQHGISGGDLHRVWRYVTILQGSRSLVLRDIAGGCYYGTSALLHEVIELSILLKRKPNLLLQEAKRVKEFLHDNANAHVEGLAAEYLYLQKKIRELFFDEEIGIGALIHANASDYDFWLLFDSEKPIPLFPPTDEETERADKLLGKLRSIHVEGVR